MKIQAVILAAGKGTRIGGDVPKVLLELKDKPLISHIVDTVLKIKDMPKPVVIVGYGGEQIKKVLGHSCEYAEQTDQLGTAHAVQAAQSKISADNVLVLYGDGPCLKTETLQRLLDFHISGNSVLTMLTATVSDFTADHEQFNYFGRIVREDGKITNIVEYKDASEGQRSIKEINPGVYVFNSDWLWTHLLQIKAHNQQGEYYLTDIAGIALSQGVEIQSLPVNSKEIRAVNTLEDLAYLESNFSSR